MGTLTRLKAANAAMRNREQPLDGELHELAGGEGPASELPDGELQFETVLRPRARHAA